MEVKEMNTVEDAAKSGLDKQVLNRKDKANKYGMWFNDNADPAEIVSWCNGRIQKYKEWIKNCEELRKDNQNKLFDGMSVEDLMRILDEKKAQTQQN